MRQLMRKSALIAICLLLTAVSYAETSIRGDNQDFYFYPAETILLDELNTGDILVFGGNVKVTGTLKGNLSVINGDAEVTGGTIDGDAVIIGGHLEVSESGTIEGSKVVFASILKKNKTMWLMVSTLFWMLTIGFGYLFFPSNIRENAFEFGDDFIKAFFLGLYSSVILIFMTLLSFIMMKIVIGIFLFLFMMISIFVLYTFSILTVFHYIGNFVWKRLLKRQQPGLVAMLTGLALYQSLIFLGILGFVGYIVLLLGGIGATLLSRFGSFKPWFGVPRYWAEEK